MANKPAVQGLGSADRREDWLPLSLTLRVTDLPSNTTENDVKSFFEDRIQRSHGKQVVEAVGPICSAANSTRSTTVSFCSHNAAQKALDLKPSNRRLTAFDGGASTLNLDDSFSDLTTIHYAANPETGKPDIE
ncbi:MAG: hypothetical protein Q9214_002279 [Letrouitia sp. 1 TL-2023]